MRTIVCIGLIVMTTFPAVAGLGAGDSAVVRGEYRLAIDEYQETLDANPDHVRALYSIARAETLLAETLSGNEAEMYFANAAAHARQAIAGDDSDPEGYFELARVLGRLAQLRGVFQALNLAGEMRAALETAVALDPGHADAIHALARWHLEVPGLLGGRKGRVRPLFDRVIELEPDVIVHRVGHAEVLLALGEHEAARAELELALAFEAVTAVDHDDQERARQLLEEHF